MGNEDNVKLGLDYEEELTQDEEMAEKDINGAASDAEGAVEQDEKTLTQAEVDEIVKERLARERKKYADYDELKTKHDTLEEITQTLKQAGLDGSAKDQIKALREYYGLSADKPEADTVADKTVDSETKAFVEAERFSRKASDSDVVDEVERILAVPVGKRKVADNVKLEVLQDRYGNILFKKDYDEAFKWFADNGEGEFSKLLLSDEFKEFAEGSSLPLKKTVQKYLKFSGKTKEPKSPGSAKDVSGGGVKEYYSPAEVDKLTDKQLEDPKIWNAVRKSMTKWK